MNLSSDKPYLASARSESREARSTQLLGELVSYLTREYPDEFWDGTTRELLEEANDHLGRDKIMWSIDNGASPDF
ncbi:MAG: hypothetical protein V5B36_05500 [Candidatus Accumulibacter sp. UW25]|jgi:hypothetical protein